jgi:hypothetical protein
MPRFLRSTLFALARGLVMLALAGGVTLATGAIAAGIYAAPVAKNMRAVQQGAAVAVMVVGYGGLAAAVLAYRVAAGLRQRRALGALSSDVSVYGFGLMGRGVSATGTLAGCPYTALAHGWDHLSVAISVPSRDAWYVGPGSGPRTVGPYQITADGHVADRVAHGIGGVTDGLGWAEVRTLMAGDGVVRFDSRGAGMRAFAPATVRAWGRGLEALLGAVGT